MLLGLLFGGGGSSAVFVSDNQVGTAGLLALSALFVLIGLSGRVPIRFQLGENYSIHWAEMAAEAAAEYAPEPVAVEIVEAVRESDRSTLASRLDSIVEAREIESLVGAGITRALEAQPRKYKILRDVAFGDPYGGLRTWDFVIDGIKGGPILVEAIGSRSLTSNRLHVISKRAESDIPGLGAPASVLLVTSASLSPGVADLVSRLNADVNRRPRMHIVQVEHGKWSSESEIRKVASAFSALTV